MNHELQNIDHAASSAAILYRVCGKSPHEEQRAVIDAVNVYHDGLKGFETVKELLKDSLIGRPWRVAKRKTIAHQVTTCYNFKQGGEQMNPISSIMLIEVLKELSSEFTTKTLPYLLVLDASDETLSHLKYGLKKKGSSYTAYWPDHESWLKKARANVSLKSYLTECRDSGIFDLLGCCPSSADQVISLENQMVSIFDTVFEKYYSGDVAQLKNQVSTLLVRFDAPQQDLDELQKLDDHLLISRYLVTKAKNNRGSVIFSKRRMEENAKTKLVELKAAKTEVTSEPSKLQFCTCFDLNRMGLSTLDISRQLIANDAALYGADILGANAGTVEQWASQIVAAPDNWYFLCNGTDIVGNWSYTYLSPAEEKSVRKGTFAGDDFSLESVNYPLTASDREVVIYILNISLNEGYQTTENWNMLWKNFGGRMKQLIQSGVTVKGLYGCLFRDDHKVMFERMGFQWLARNVVSGEVYYLDLNQTDLSRFGWIMGTNAVLGPAEQNIIFRQLNHDDILAEQQLVDIAGLIYDTDQYIYPQMFTREQAKRLIPLLLAGNGDRMFSLDNIFCAVVGDRIVGLILHKKGPLNWDSGELLMYARLLDEKLSDTINVVEDEYFREYDSTTEDATAILNCCVNGNYRMRNDIRLGTRMMQAFVAQHPERLELYVLQETLAAMRLYLRTGFQTSEQDKCNGFSIDHRDLPCYFMYRPAR